MYKHLEQLQSKYKDSINLIDTATHLYLDCNDEIPSLSKIIETIYLKIKYNNYNSNMIIGYLNRLIMEEKLQLLNNLIDNTNIDKIESINNSEFTVFFNINNVKYSVTNVKYQTLIKMIRTEINKIEDESLRLNKLNQL